MFEIEYVIKIVLGTFNHVVTFKMAFISYLISIYSFLLILKQSFK